MGIAALLSLYAWYSGNIDVGYAGIAIAMVGFLIVFFSLSKRNRIKVANALDPCQCCKCTNCGENHNHWTHD